MGLDPATPNADVLAAIQRHLRDRFRTIVKDYEQRQIAINTDTVVS